MEWVDVKLQTELADAAHKIARDRDVTVGQLLRDLLAREISKMQRARPPVRADERLVAPLRARLAVDLSEAKTWTELEQRLAQKGYKLAAAGGGLVLQEHPSGRRICKASELGFSYSRLLRRIGSPFPGHPHTYLAHRFTDVPIDEAQQPLHMYEPTQKGSPIKDITDDFDVIEPF